MDDNVWQELLAEFRELGGLAENICLRDGAYGRGLFPIDPAKPAAIRIPDTLLADSAWAEFHDGVFRLAPDAKIGNRERIFLEEYQNALSWGGGARHDLEQIVEQAQQLPPELRQALTSEFHCGPWFADPTDRLVEELFVGSRPLRYKGRTVSCPSWPTTERVPIFSPVTGSGFMEHFQERCWSSTPISIPTACS